jgi:hypothetical protein
MQERELSRQQFDAWCEANGYGIDDMFKPLQETLVRLLWPAWQAARAQQSEPVVERISYGTGLDWWWSKINCPVGTKLYASPPPAVQPVPVAQFSPATPCMDIYSQPGTPVVFMGINGYPSELKDAREVLEVGKTYRVARTHLHSTSTGVELMEVAGVFNSVHFTAAAPSPDKQVPDKPVAQRIPNERGHHHYWDYGESYSGTVEPENLYLHPAKPEQVPAPLTDERIAGIALTVWEYDDDIDRLTEFARAIEAACTPPEGWISVDDRLPDFEVPVLGVIGESIYPVCRYDDSDGWLWGCLHIGALDDVMSYECDDDYQVTHWMPLPAAPMAGKTSPEQAP